MKKTKTNRELKTLITAPFKGYLHKMFSNKAHVIFLGQGCHCK